MGFKIHPLWWPFLLITSPIIIPYLFFKNRSYKARADEVDDVNKERIKKTSKINLPEIKSLNITALIEAKSESDLKTEAGISYFLETEESEILFDISFSNESPVFDYNLEKLNLNPDNLSTVFISHLHPDHMGGIKASQYNKISLPKKISSQEVTVYLPNTAEVNNAEKSIVDSPELITGKAATTGPLKANLFFSGATEEQSLIYNVKNKGAVVIIGCGHPDLEKIFKMVEKITSENIYAVVGGLHLPLKNGRIKKAGIDFQRLIGTGEKPWLNLDENYLDNKIDILKKADPEKILLSPHDSSDYALEYLQSRLNSDIEIIKSGNTYQL